MTTQERYSIILERIEKAANQAGRRPPTLIAVSKKQPLESVRELYDAGHRDFGENYVQELCTKARSLESAGCTGIRWHLIGHLQTNKVKMLLPHVHSVHTVDSIKLARELDRRWSELHPSGPPLPVFIEVNVDVEDSKSGIRPEEARVLAAAFADLSGLKLEGLMCIPGWDRPDHETRLSFERLRKLEEQCHPLTQGQLSMGMSDDFELAIREGATHIRVGTALFGPRPTPEKAG